MIARILPPQEWPRLKGTEAEALWPHLDPENARVLVVEEGGQIIATWTFFRTVHAECIWIAPEKRGSLGVAKRLLRGMKEIASAWGAAQVITGSISRHVTDLIVRWGGIPLPCKSFVLPVNGPRDKKAQDEQLGKAFHRELAMQVTEDIHPEDPEHDERVGRALRKAVHDQAPEAAMTEYNIWALGAGYEPIKFLGKADGKLRADIVTAVIEIDEHYGIRVLEEAVCQSAQR